MKNRIKLINKYGKERYYSLEAGIKILRKNNPKEKFRIAKCEYTKENVIQYKHKDVEEWVCLHD